MKKIFQNWSTTLLGGSLIGTAVNDYMTTGNIKQNLIVIAMGLIGVFTQDVFKKSETPVK